MVLRYDRAPAGGHLIKHHRRGAGHPQIPAVTVLPSHFLEDGLPGVVIMEHCLAHLPVMQRLYYRRKQGGKPA